MHPCVVLTENRELVVSKSVPKAEVLLEIPIKCLVSKETALSTVAGERFSSIIESRACKFHNAAQDLLIAMCLASKKDPQVTALFGHYLETLPASSSYDMLPRRWNDSELTSLLSGTCLLDRVRKSRDGAKNDYNEIHKSWNEEFDSDESFPSFADFDDMLAAVTSRAFAGMGGSRDQDIAMIPVLDLCNHHRGNVTKNVSYCKSGSAVQVVASEDLDGDMVLGITYGARGNAQLLFNYGFCVPDNLEPDGKVEYPQRTICKVMKILTMEFSFLLWVYVGSSNDVFEFKAKEGLPPVELRTGPKAYTFLPFAKVLELFRSELEGGAAPQEEMNDFDDKEDDMEAFLNGCEEEEDQDEWEDEDDGAEDDPMSEEQTIKAELLALAAMQEAFEAAKERYLFKADDLERALDASGTSQRHYAAILVASELRAIFLYELGIQHVREKLTKNVEDSSLECRVHLEDGDKERVVMQAKDLAQAFMNIRCPRLSTT